jgi:hypothetical protein
MLRRFFISFRPLLNAHSSLPQSSQGLESWIAKPWILLFCKFLSWSFKTHPLTSKFVACGFLSFSKSIDSQQLTRFSFKMHPLTSKVHHCIAFITIESKNFKYNIWVLARLHVRILGVCCSSSFKFQTFHCHRSTNK